MYKGKMTVVLFFFLVLVLIVAGCSDKSVNNSNNNTNVSQNEVESEGTDVAAESNDSEVNYDKKYEIKWYQWGPRDIHEDDAIIAYLNEKFNVDIQLERILHKEFTKNLELKIASGDMPDVFRYSIGQGAHIYNQLYEDDYLMDFSEYAEKYDFQGLKEYMNRPGTEEYREEDGIFQLPTRKAGVSDVMIVRQDWLDELGLEHPTTWEEFKDMLQAFKDNKMGGDSTIPFTTAFGPDAITSISIAFTGVNSWGKVDNKWMNSRIMPEYKPFIHYISELYQEGLLDREIFTASEAQSKAKFVSGSSGVYKSPTERLGPVEKDLLEVDGDAKLSLIIPQPKGPIGDRVNSPTSYSEPMLVTKKDRDEDFLIRVAALMDFMHSEEGIQILNFGLEGVHYNLEDGERVNTELHERDMIPALGHLTAQTSDYSLAAGDVEDRLKTNFDYSKEFGLEAPLSALTYGDSNDLVPSIDKKFDEWFIKFVTGEEDIDEKWDQYVQEMNDAGLAELTSAVEENTQHWDN